jgi:transcriptional regulator with XRE-family HTH domain
VRQVDEATGSTVPRRQLGRYLRDLRTQAGMTVRAAARNLEWSETKLWRIENGRTSLRSLDVEQMCRMYQAPDELTTSLMALAKQTKARGWWLPYEDVINVGFDIYLGLEGAATRLSWYETDLIPGLLQTPGYASTMIRAGHPELDEGEIGRRVELRMARQSLLTRAVDPPTLQVVLGETILKRSIGGPEVMADQLAHLSAVGSLPNVSIRVVRVEVGLHAGVMSGPFVLLEFPTNGSGQPSEPPTVCVDSFTGVLFLDKPHEVATYADAFKDIWRVASDEAASRAFIQEVAREFGR